MNNLLLTYYGDDLTGSTDSMEALELGGIPTVLFLEPPTPERLARFQRARAVGLAGVSRTMSPGEMDAALPEIFAILRQLGAPLTHYKVCSTFDSSPEIGNIGRATEIGRQIFANPIVPVMVGAPKLKRYVAFGNLFATAGDVTYRLDRHPTMRKHPMTPMDEADLRLHLGRQTDLSIGLIDMQHLAKPDEQIDARINWLVAEGIQAVILDTLDNNHLLKTGRLLWTLGQKQPAFVVGSSGVEFALTAYWGATGLAHPPEELASPGAVGQIVAMSGSAAPMAAAQIEHALERGFEGIRLDSASLIDPRTTESVSVRAQAIQQALLALQAGKSVILYSALGPDDANIAKTKHHMEALGIPPRTVGERLGKQQGLILKEILLNSGIRRCAVAGGDTSGNVLKQLGAYVLEFLVPLGAATPLCRAGSHESALDGLQVALKGGQLGEIDFFERVLHGRIFPSR